MRFIDRSSTETLLDNYESEAFSFFIPLLNNVVIDGGAIFLEDLLIYFQKW
jgi:hypothetical protein